VTVADEKDKQPKGGADKPKPRSRSKASASKADSKAGAAKSGTGTRTRQKKDADAPKQGARKPAAKAKAAPKAQAKTEPKAQAKAEAKAPARSPARRRGAAKEESKPAAAPRRTSREAPARPTVRAQAKYVRSSARKARLVMDHVRGKSVGDARAVLRHSPRGAARDVERLLESAIANAENNHDLVGDDLYVKEIYADEGPTLKRFRPRAQGRVYRVRKRTSHLSVALTTRD
jgi:ribosomal protein L22